MKRAGQGLEYFAPRPTADFAEDFITIARGETLHPLHFTQGNRAHRLAFQEPVQIVRQVGRASIAPVGLLLPAFQANRFQVPAHIVLHPTRPPLPLDPPPPTTFPPPSPFQGRPS